MDPWLNWLVGFGIWIGLIIVFAAITLLIVGVNISGKQAIYDDLFNYSRKSDVLPEEGYFLDTHSHTLASDGVMTPEQLIKWEIANGYDAFVLTDHNTGKNNKPILELQGKYPEILIIPGYEWTTQRIHLNFLGIEEWPDKVPNNPSNDEIKDAIRTAKDMGAIVQVDHISWTVDQPGHRTGQYIHPTRDQLLEWGVHGYEINNEMRWYDPKTLHWLDKKRENDELDRPVYIATGTDIHNPLKSWATGWTQLLLTNQERNHVTWKTVKNALLEGRTKIWVDHDYVEPPELKLMRGGKIQTLRERIFPPLFALKYGIEKIPGTVGGIFLYVFWFIVAYFPLRLIFELIISL